MSKAQTLLIVAVVFMGCFSSPVRGAESKIYTDPLDPRRFAEQVFVGNDGDMPLDGPYRLAIRPRVSNTGEIVVPGSIIEGLTEMRRAAPHWLLKALKESGGDQECGVHVNNVSYNGLISQWMWVHWVQPGSAMAVEFQRLGADIRNRLTITNALTVGLCDLVKTDDERQTMEYLAFLVKIPLVQ